MSKVEFEEFNASVDKKNDANFNLIQWIRKHSMGLFKNEEQVQIFLIGFIVLAFILILIMMFNNKEHQYHNASSSDSNYVPAVNKYE